MIKKTVDYWVAGFNLPSDSDLSDAIDAAKEEKSVVILHWHTPAYPYYGSQSDVTLEVNEGDTVDGLREILSKIVYPI